MTDKKRVHPLQKPVHPYVGIAVIVGGVALVIIAVSNHKLRIPDLRASIPTALQVTPSESVLTPTLPPGFGTQKFTSPDLGISFDFQSSAHPKETEDKVYFDYGNPPEQSTFVEVMSKDPKSSITDAITKNILKGNTNNCSPRLLDYHTALHSPRITISSSYIYAGIQFPQTTPYNVQTDEAAMAKCTFLYTNGYFLVDQNHPNKLLFIHEMQNWIDSGKSTKNTFIPWDATIRFVVTQ